MILSFRHLIVTVVCLTLSSADATVTAKEARNAESERDTLCGPRCVRFLLEYYGLEANGSNNDLATLVKELQWPVLEKGSTLSGLQQSLAARGIETRAETVMPDQPLRSRTPVIVHLTTPKDELGHFVVWLPSSSRATVDYWSYPAGLLRMNAETFNNRRSNIVLPVTSPAALQSDNTDLTKTGWQPLDRALLSLICGVIATLLVLRKRDNRTTRVLNHPDSSSGHTDVSCHSKESLS